MLDLEADKTYFIHIEIIDTGHYKLPGIRFFNLRPLDEKKAHKRLAKDTLILHDLE